MKFFTYESGYFETEQFGYLHFIALGVFALLITALILFRKKLKNPKTDKTVRYTATVIAVLLEAFYHIMNYIYGNDFVVNIIPFELCSISLWMSVILCFSGNKKIFEVLYFFAIGAIASIMVPNINGLGPDRLRYYH